MSRISQISSDVLILSDTVPVDGRVSWVAPSAKGHEPYNVYVVLSENRVLLIDTGVAVHGPSLMPTLLEVVGSRELIVFTTRIELESIGNLGRILDQFPGAQVTTTIPIAPTGLVHKAASTPVPRPVVTLAVGDTLAELGFARLRTTRPLIQTLGTCWVIDAKTQVLFTTDMFCAEMLPLTDDPIVQERLSPLMTPGYIREAVLQKFDWLGVADLGPLREQWDQFFNSFTPEVLAPIHGRAHKGADLVKRIVAAYREAIFGSVSPRHETVPRTS